MRFQVSLFSFRVPLGQTFGDEALQALRKRIDAATLKRLSVGPETLHHSAAVSGNHVATTSGTF